MSTNRTKRSLNGSFFLCLLFCKKHINVSKYFIIFDILCILSDLYVFKRRNLNLILHLPNVLIKITPKSYNYA